MSGQLKEVRIRMASVKSTQQITKAMKVVSAAKLRKAQDAIIQIRPYAEKLNGILENIMAADAESTSTIALAQKRPLEKILLIVISSDRGLCGSFNSNIIKTTINRIHGNYEEQDKNKNVTLLCIGKKANEYFKKRGYNVISDYVNLLNELSFEKVAEIAQRIQNEFLNGTYDKVDLINAQFKNAATQIFKVSRYLPVSQNSKKKEKKKVKEEKENKIDFIYEPAKNEIIEVLIPKILNTQLFRSVLDSNASEHGARMTAMDKATENAADLLKQLNISYNRARQAAITTEISEIVGGAAALQEG